MKVAVIADVCFNFLRDLNLHTVHQDIVLSLTNSVLAEHVTDNQVFLYKSGSQPFCPGPDHP